MNRKDFLKASGLTSLGLACGAPVLASNTVSGFGKNPQNMEGTKIEKNMENKVELLAAYFTISGDIYPFGPTEISPFQFKDRVEAAAKAGYKGFGIIHADMMATAEKIGLKEMKNILIANGMTKLEFEFLGGWFESGEIRKESDLMRKEMLAAADILQPTNIKIAPKLHVDETGNNVSLMVEEFAKLAEQAGQHGTNIALEIMPFSNVRTVETALAIASGADHKNGGLLLDIWHINRGNISYEKLAQVPNKYIKSIEMNDADKYAISPLWQDTIHRRRLPGEGVLDQKGFIDAIKKTGYKGHWGVEVLSEVVRKWPLEEMANRTFETTMKQFS